MWIMKKYICIITACTLLNVSSDFSLSAMAYNNIENKNYTIIESWVKLMANVSIRMDDALKKQAEELFNDLGMNLTTAFTIFVKQAIREQGIPFEITKETPNSETLSALREVEEMKKNPSLGKSYTDVDKMMEDLLS